MTREREPEQLDSLGSARRWRLDPNRPTTDKVIPLAEAYYRLPHNAVGGSLHIVLDDENIDDHHIEYCLRFAMGQGAADGYGPRYGEGSDVVDGPGTFLAGLLLEMSRTQRRKVAEQIRPWDDDVLDLAGFWAEAACLFPDRLCVVA